MICEFCGRTDPDRNEYCDDRDGRKRHHLVSGLRSASGLGQSGAKRKPAAGGRSSFTPASPEQRAKTRESWCVVCGETPADSAHLIPRSLTSVGQEDERATVALCRKHHRDYDQGRLDLLPFERHFAVEMGYAVERFGSVPTINRVSNGRWVDTSETDRRAA